MKKNIKIIIAVIAFLLLIVSAFSLFIASLSSTYLSPRVQYGSMWQSTDGKIQIYVRTKNQEFGNGEIADYHDGTVKIKSDTGIWEEFAFLVDEIPTLMDASAEDDPRDIDAPDGKLRAIHKVVLEWKVDRFRKADYFEAIITKSEIQGYGVGDDIAFERIVEGRYSDYDIQKVESRQQIITIASVISIVCSGVLVALAVDAICRKISKREKQTQ